MNKRELTIRVSAIKLLPVIPVETAQLIKAAERELKRNNLKVAYAMIVLAESYILAPYERR
jgi:hypothetical protein